MSLGNQKCSPDEVLVPAERCQLGGGSAGRAPFAPRLEEDAPTSAREAAGPRRGWRGLSGRDLCPRDLETYAEALGGSVGVWLADVFITD